MRVIICGAGQVGYNIAAYLSREDNDVTVIDINPGLVARINDELDVNGIVGHASSPDILEKAGAKDADILLAVTHQDEVNMVACQVAHSLFNVPKKVARIREQAYLDPAWHNLFSRAHMPIDVIISPEIELSAAIEERLDLPGCTNVVSMADGKALLVNLICNDDCPLVNTPMNEIHKLFSDLSFQVLSIFRKGRMFIPSADDQMLIGDEVCFVVDKDHLDRAMIAFGHEEKEARRITILGGGDVGAALASRLNETHKNLRINMIEPDQKRAAFLSSSLPESIVVINGNGLNQDIMAEAEISDTETLVAVTDDDETNILGALLAKQFGCERVIALVNKTIYSPIIHSLGIDSVISPRTNIVSRIMRHVRRGRIKGLYSLWNGVAEIMEIELSDTCSVVNTPIKELKLPESVIFGAIIRNESLLILDEDTTLHPKDRLILLAGREHAAQVEKMFSVQVELF